MANKKESDTLAQQRKARQQFLELKKMESGEIAPEPKPSEVAIVPKTFSEKLQNYWFHFKWHTIGAVLSIVLLIVLVSQCASSTDWDMQVVYFSYTPVIDTQTRAVADYLETLSEDINGDGEVNINVVNCSISETSRDSQYRQTVLSKLQVMISSEPEAMLYITDKSSQKFFTSDSLKNFFETEQLSLNEKFYSATKLEDFGSLPEGLQIACRRVGETTLEGNKKAEAVYKEAKKILEKLK